MPHGERVPLGVGDVLAVQGHEDLLIVEDDLGLCFHQTAPFVTVPDPLEALPSGLPGACVFGDPPLPR